MPRAEVLLRDPKTFVAERARESSSSSGSRAGAAGPALSLPRASGAPRAHPGRVEAPGCVVKCPVKHARRHRPPGSPRPQPEGDRRHHPHPQAGGDHRRFGLGQEQPGLRHALRRGAAPLRREPLLLRAPVPGADGEAARGRGLRHLSGDRDPPADALAQPALHGGDRDRDPRPPAAALRARRPRRVRGVRRGGPARLARARGGAAAARPRGQPDPGRLSAARAASPGRAVRTRCARGAAKARLHAPAGRRRGGRDRGPRGTAVPGGRARAGRSAERARGGPQPHRRVARDGSARGRAAARSWCGPARKRSASRSASSARAASGRPWSRSRASSPSTTPSARARPATASAT